MPRRPRLDYPGAIHHVMARGNRKACIFEDDDDRRCFLEIVAETADTYDVRVYAYCQMDNHYHIVCETPRGNLSDAMRQINGVYAQSSNRRHGRSGHLFGARFRSLLIQWQSYLKRSARYVVLNPVRARITRDANGWPWSSYRATAGIEPAPDWLCLDWLEAAFECPTRAEAQRRYIQYVNTSAAARVRFNTSAVAVGSKAFVERVEAMSNRQADRPLPPVYMPAVRPDLATLFAAPSSSLAERDRRIREASSRHGYRLSEIACQLMLDPSTVSKALRRVREGR
jgi:REP element-mobilizing transposase RayT/DNA-binding transcriptional ArsR family regulator